MEITSITQWWKLLEESKVTSVKRQWFFWKVFPFDSQISFNWLILPVHTSTQPVHMRTQQRMESGNTDQSETSKE